jgi:hypothetical protein
MYRRIAPRVLIHPGSEDTRKDLLQGCMLYSSGFWREPYRNTNRSKEDTKMIA